MFNLIKNVFAVAQTMVLFFRSGEIRNVFIENLILRQQLSNFKLRLKVKPKISRFDRVFWILVSKKISTWKELLVIVKPETVISWHKRAFKLFWKLKSRNKGGRPRVSKEIQKLIIQMATENRWGAPRIHGELIHLGIKISEATVSRYMPKRKATDSQHQSWRTFLRNTLNDTISIDFFTIPTAGFRILYGFIVLSHERREIIHCNVTYNPFEFWVMNQLKEALWEREDEFKYLMRDNGASFGRYFKNLLQSYRITDCPTSFRSPWQNPYCERVIGSIRRELLDNVIIINENQARNLLKEYAYYYNQHRTHLSLEKNYPTGKKKHIGMGKVESIPLVGGLHHRYERAKFTLEVGIGKVAA